MITGNARIFIVIALVAAIAFGIFPLALLVALILGTSELTLFWSAHALDRLEYRRLLSQTRAFFGEEIDLNIQIVNRKLLPVAWVDIEDEIPEALKVPGRNLLPSSKPRHVLLENFLSLGPYEQVTRHYRLACGARGYWPLGPAIARSGDAFGFRQNECEIGDVDWLLVYPRMVAVERLGLPAKRPFGDLRARERLVEDPSRLRAIRPYQPGDPLRHVHWKATAKTSEVQVRQFDPTATLDLLIVLNVATFEQAWQGVRPDLLETAISVAASSASHALAEGFSVGLLVNASLPRSDQPIKILPGRGPDQRFHILEALAKLSPFVSVSLEGLLRRERRSLPWGATIVVVTAVAGEGLLAILTALRRNGHRVVIISIGDAPVRQLGGIVVYQIPSWSQEEAPVLSI